MEEKKKKEKKKEKRVFFSRCPFCSMTFSFLGGAPDEKFVFICPRCGRIVIQTEWEQVS